LSSNLPTGSQESYAGAVNYPKLVRKVIPVLPKKSQEGYVGVVTFPKSQERYAGVVIFPKKTGTLCLRCNLPKLSLGKVMLISNLPKLSQESYAGVIKPTQI